MANVDISAYGRASAREVLSTWVRAGYKGTGVDRDLKLSAYNETASGEVSAVLHQAAATSTLTFTKTSSTGFKITGVDAVPSAASDVANKQYVDSVAQGLDVKEAVTVATTTNLVGTYAAVSSGVGDTFTITATGVLTIDDIAVVLNDRVLIKDQTSQHHNGIYTVTTAGAAGVSAVLTRSVDFDTVAKMNAGSFTFVSKGTALSGRGYVMTSTITAVGTAGNDVVFTVFTSAGSFTAGPGINITGSVIKVKVKSVGTNPVLGYQDGTTSSTTATDDIRLLSRAGYPGSVLIGGNDATDDPVFGYKIGPTTTTAITNNGLLTVIEPTSRTSTGATTDGGLVIESTNSTTNNAFSPSLYIGAPSTSGTYRTSVVGDGTNQVFRVQRRDATAYSTLFTIEP